MTLTQTDPAVRSADGPTADSDPALRDRLVHEHLPLVEYLVREVRSRIPAHVAADELLSAARYALVVSARGYDPRHGVPFVRYATMRIRGALTDELRAMDWASRGARAKARELETVRDEIAQRLGRGPSRAELRSASGMSDGELAAVEHDAARAGLLSLQALETVHGPDIVTSAAEGPEDVLVRRDQIGWLRDAVVELPERLRTVVVGYFFEHRKMADLARELGVSESRVSQLRAEALRMLRTAMHDENAEPAPVADSSDAGSAYAAAVAARSTTAGRLAATTLLGDASRAPGRAHAG